MSFLRNRLAMGSIPQMEPGVRDPYWSNVKFLTNGDLLSDISSNAYTVTASGDMAVTTAQKKFGSGSWGFDGTGDYATVGANTNWTFMHLANSVWTWEAWLRVTSFAAERVLFSTSNGSTGDSGLYVSILTDRKVNIGMARAVASTYVVNGTFATAYPNDTSGWHHVAITWDHTLGSANATLWIDGESSGTLNKTGNSPSTNDATAALKLGGYNTFGTYLGQMDEIRITNAVRRYTAAFTPPGGPFQSH